MKQLLIISLFFTCSVAAQNVILMHDVNDDVDSEMGPGKKMYVGGTFSYGIPIGDLSSNYNPINMGKSFRLGYGVINKWQPTRILGFGYLFDYNLTRFDISQKAGADWGYDNDFEWERFWTVDVNLDAFIRINFVKRGDHHGIYLDLAGYVGYDFISRYSYRQDVQSPNSKSYKVVERELKYINRLDYGPSVRFGLSFLSIYARYRMSDMFKTDFQETFPELPRLMVGIMITS